MASDAISFTKLNKITRLVLRCRSCGSTLYAIGSSADGFCNICEAYVNSLDNNNAQSNPAVSENLGLMSSSLESKKWIDGANYADLLAATKDPYVLYGAATFYSLFSDYTYNDVNYKLGGFMYDNASKRSDDLKKNKYNAMALTSKSREYFYKTLKVIGDISTQSETLIYLNFITNMKLGRNAQAFITLNKMRGWKAGNKLLDYAEMVYAEKTDVKKADVRIVRMMDLNVVNSFYYMAKYLARTKDFDDSKVILNAIVNSTGMPMASTLLNKITDVEKAMGKEED